MHTFYDVFYKLYHYLWERNLLIALKDFPIAFLIADKMEISNSYCTLSWTR